MSMNANDYDFKPDEAYFQKRSSNGIYGWRKTLIWCLVFFVVILAIVNIALTAWIIKQLNMDRDGIQGLSISADSTTVDNDLFVGASVAANAYAGYTLTSVEVLSDLDLIVKATRDVAISPGKNLDLSLPATGTFSVEFPSSTPLSVTQTAVTVNVPLALTRPFTATGLVSLSDLQLVAITDMEISAAGTIAVTTPSSLSLAAATVAVQPLSASDVVFYTGNTIPKILSQCSCTTSASGSTELVLYWVDAASTCSSIPAARLAALCP